MFSADSCRRCQGSPASRVLSAAIEVKGLALGRRNLRDTVVFQVRNMGFFSFESQIWDFVWIFWIWLSDIIDIINAQWITMGFDETTIT
jgi:hypothetical protein